MPQATKKEPHPEERFGEARLESRTDKSAARLSDARLCGVEWRDLVALSARDAASELLLPAPWLALSLALAAYRWEVPALAASFVFFLAGLRVVHNAYHYALGLSRRATEWMMLAFSVLMLGSMHAIQRTHLQHHKDCLGDGDVEAMSARLSAARAIAIGPLFPIRLHVAALRAASPRHRRWIVAKLAANVASIALVFGALDCVALRYHVAAMALG